jgi:hypothetical protein
VGWVRWDDDFYDHPKWIKAGPLGIALGSVSTAWCNRNLTDGFVPAAKVPTLISFDGIEDGGQQVTPAGIAERLVEVGLWNAVPGGYEIHDYLDRQPSKAEVLEKREKERQRWERRSSANSNAPPPRSGDGVHHNSSKTPSATQTQPQDEIDKSISRSRRKSLTKLPDDFEIIDAMRLWAKAKTPTVDIDYETEKFTTSAQAHERRYANWERAWQNWMLNAPQMGGKLLDLVEQADPDDRFRTSEITRWRGILATQKKVTDPDLDLIAEAEAELKILGVAV